MKRAFSHSIMLTCLLAMLSAVGCTSEPARTFRLPTFNVPSMAGVPAPPSPSQDSSACARATPTWYSDRPLGQVIIVIDTIRDDLNRTVAEPGRFRIDQNLGSYTDLASADAAAYAAVRAILGHNDVRWVVLENSFGFHVYRAQYVAPVAGLVPCTVPPDEGSLAGYHALAFDGIWQGSGYIRYDWNYADGGRFADGAGLPGTIPQN